MQQMINVCHKDKNVNATIVLGENKNVRFHFLTNDQNWNTFQDPR